jgi:hypothetical protein
LKTFKHDVNSGIFKYFLNTQKYITDLQIHDKPHIQSLQKQFSSINISNIEPVYSTFTPFRSFEEIAEFIKYAM